jgi:hypothetical protein
MKEERENKSTNSKPVNVYKFQLSIRSRPRRTLYVEKENIVDFTRKTKQNELARLINQTYM